MSDEREPVEVWFSFRSPYSRFALHRLDAALAGLPVRAVLHPIFPEPGFAGDPTKAAPAKVAHLFQDLIRHAKAYGLAMRPPKSLDTDWIRPHAAFLHAEDAGRGLAFARAAFDARFADGLDLAEDATLSTLAAAVGLEPADVVAAADDPALRARVEASRTRARAEGIFGVPLFAFREQRFWGNDRLEWLVRAIREQYGLPVPDLAANPLASPAG